MKNLLLNFCLVCLLAFSLQGDDYYRAAAGDTGEEEEGGGSTVISFDGVDDRISFGGIATGDDTYSVTAWIRASSFTDSWQSILTQGGGDGLYLRLSQLVAFGTSGGSHFSNTAISQDTWYHVAFVNNGVNWVIYLNGTSDATGANGGTCGALTHMGDNDGSDTFHGRLADVAVFSIALSSTQVANLASKSTTPGVIGDLIAWLPLDEVANGSSGNGVTFVDDANANDGTGNDGANDTGLTGVTADY